MKTANNRINVDIVNLFQSNKKRDRVLSDEERFSNAFQVPKPQALKLTPISKTPMNQEEIKMMRR